MRDILIYKLHANELEVKKREKITAPKSEDSCLDSFYSRCNRGHRRCIDGNNSVIRAGNYSIVLRGRVSFSFLSMPILRKIS